MSNLKFKTAFLAVLSTAIFFQCSSNKTEIEYSKVHFDVNGILEDQMTYLEESGASLEKHVEFDGKKAELKLDTVDWEKELRLFKSLNINKPALAPLYDSVISGDNVIYSLKEDDSNSKLKSLEIKRNNKKELIQFTGIIKENNYLYKSEKILVLNFDIPSQNIKTYDLNVSTQVIFRENEKSEVHGEVIY
jgi:hypothetical protein